MVSLSPYRIEPGSHLDLQTIDPDETGFWTTKELAKEGLKAIRKRISDLQERLYAENRQSLLVVLQAMDTGGKDGTIRNVFSGVNPQGVQVHAFGTPTEEELEHDFLWRIHRRAPERGMITIFNRSHYEDVLVVRVKNLAPPEIWQQRYEQINEFEHLLARNGTRILKFFLHVSADEQKARLQARLDDPEKHWKFRKGDLDDRALWSDFQQAYTDAITRCSTDHAPWFVIPANHKWARNALIAEIIEQTLLEMNPQFPPPEDGLDQVVIV